MPDMAIVFAAYVDGVSQVVAKGGRYDHIGQVFGRTGRGATGFSINVRNLASNVVVDTGERERVLVDHATEDQAMSLWLEIQRLRSDGYIVVESEDHNGYDYRLDYQDGEWRLLPGDQ